MDLAAARSMPFVLILENLNISVRFTAIGHRPKYGVRIVRIDIFIYSNDPLTFCSPQGGNTVKCTPNLCSRHITINDCDDELIIAVVDRDMPRTEIWRALYGIASLRRAEGKWVIAVNEDIDPDDTNAVFWAMSYRCKPHRDVEILKNKDEGHGPRSCEVHALRPYS